MSSRYIVAEGQEFNYPADLVSRQIIKSSGGRSKLSEEDKKRVSYKTVKAGEDCSDLPEPAFSIYLERGWIIKVGDTPADVPTDTPVVNEDGV